MRKRLVALVLWFWCFGAWASEPPEPGVIHQMAASYYANKGEWAGKFSIIKVLATRVEKKSPTHVVVHLKYLAALNKANEHVVEDQRTFDLVYRNNQWVVIKMGEHKSARF